MIILDLETTGFNPKKDRIIEVAAIKIEKKWEVSDTFHYLIHPGIPLPTHIQQLTGLIEKDFKQAVTWEQVCNPLYEFLRKSLVIGYNIAFDKRFLVVKDSRFSCIRYQDFLKYMRSLEYNLPNYKLHTVGRYFGLKVNKAHRAIEDVHLILKLIKKVGNVSL